MKSSYNFQTIPKSRIATFDVFAAGMLKHHINAILEFDVTNAREKIKQLKKSGIKVSFLGWITKVIGSTLEQHSEVAAFLYNKKKLIVFNDINIALIIEKELNGKKVPIPLVINKSNKKSVNEITLEIKSATNDSLSEKQIVLSRKSKAYENWYYLMPGFIRRYFWRFLLRNPKIAFEKMGNVSITSLSMMGKINGWFIHKAVHPVSFGLASVIKKPIVIDDEIKIREILNITVLIDHDVVDGKPMARFISDLAKNIEQGQYL